MLPITPFVIGGILSIVIGLLYVRRLKKKVDLTGRHVFVVGGTTGIGLSVAEYAVKSGGTVTLAARDAVRLEKVKETLSSSLRGENQKINTVKLDVTSGPNDVQEAVGKAISKSGPIDMLVCCAGTAICGRLEDMSESDIRYLTDLNFLGSLWLSRAVLPAMKARGSGSIVLVSSGAALLGIYGYSAYGATKWAIRGLGEALLMETVGTGVTVTISFPPDTDTPGFVQEEASKPLETKLISSSGGLYSPTLVGKHIIHDAVDGKAYSTVGFESWMLCTLCGIGNTNFSDALMQSYLMFPLRLVLLAYQYYFKYLINKCKGNKNDNKKAM